ncbi:MAG: DNA repair protein RadA [Candidatus Curtissbacteria bacterium]|nr:DNA repair protein RadA [Candidatus Curtissbacteria bacterium]
MKSHSEFVCQQCGYKSASFLGRCPQCGEWNSLVESVDSASGQRLDTLNIKVEESLVRLSAVKAQNLPRITSGFGEFDRVLGGGIVPGSIVLISGDPGIGKSTLLLQSAMAIAKDSEGSSAKSAKSKKVPNGDPGPSVLYVTGEESAHQVKLRADRIAKVPDGLYILPQTDVDVVVGVSEKVDPKLLIIDSIQTLTTSRLNGSAGSVGQVRESAQTLQSHAKSKGIPIIIVGHVTKEGSVAGPKVLEHLVDAVLNLEGDGMHAFRILRCNKNRFGSTYEVGVFEMTDAGMEEVANPSKIFLAQRIEKRPGSVVASTITGDRPILAEVQSLVTPTMFGIPTRRATGLDFSRVQIVIAALSKAANLTLGNLDIYVNVAGGLRIIEPAADLSVALAIVSAAQDMPVRENVCAFGEVGLLGELRPVSGSVNRMSEAKRLGFSDFITPDRFKSLEAAISYAIHGD